MMIPNRKDIVQHEGDLKAETACGHFLGKSIQQAEALFRENSLLYLEDLKWMGPAAFRYYVTAVIRYLQREAAWNESDFVVAFASTLEFRLEHESEELAEVADLLRNICSYVLANWDRFLDKNDLYGEVMGRYAWLQRSFAHLATSRNDEVKTSGVDDEVTRRTWRRNYVTLTVNSVLIMALGIAMLGIALSRGQPWLPGIVAFFVGLIGHLIGWKGLHSTANRRMLKNAALEGEVRRRMRFNVALHMFFSSAAALVGFPVFLLIYLLANKPSNYIEIIVSCVFLCVFFLGALLWSGWRLRMNAPKA